MQNVLVLGKGSSGKSAKELLEKIGYNVILAETYEIENKKDRFFKKLSFICVSPGISVDNCVLERARALGVKIIGELELGFKYLSSKVVAITGTNGKTTTTKLIGDICKCFKNTFVGGNIGVPVTSFCDKTSRGDLCVLEVSSFQAESFESFRPDISVFLNFQDDHLDRHKTRENYFKAKLKMFERQTNKDYAVLFYDDEAVRGLQSNINANVFFYSTKCSVKGCYLKKDCIYFNDGNVAQKLFCMPSNVIGEHNKQNILAAITVAKILGVTNKIIEDVVENFKPEINRLEMVSKVGGVTFINDSKSTNIASTLAAIKSFKEKIVLILGGSDKGYEFSNLFCFTRRKVRAIVVVGQTSEKIMAAAESKGFTAIHKENGFENAVRKAFNLAKTGDVVLLSPACASFDMFSSYKQRGEEFKRIVREIEYENNKNAGNKKT